MIIILTYQKTIIGKISNIALTWQRYQQKLLLPHQITVKQFAVLEQLAHYDFLYPSDLADYLYADRPTITVIINNLIKAGYVAKAPDETNKKRTRITITENGRTRLARCQTDPRCQSKIKITACLSTKEKELLHALLDKINNHLKQLDLKEDLRDE